MLRRTAAVVAALAVLAGACGGGAEPATTAEEAVSEAATPADATGGPTGGVEMTQGDAGVEVTGEPDQKPVVAVPDAAPPAQLTYTDLVVGEGEEVPAGAEVTTHYVGVAWDSGEQFDSSWDRGEPISFPLSGVITGWQDGIPGMRVGGRRLLVIPPKLAYGDQAPPGANFGPGATLVFVIDVVAAA